jgi:DNA-binding response OmpR family regulator
MREYFRRLLNPQYDVEAVPDGEAALAAVRQRPPDLGLADVRMPRLDGFGLIRALRADECAGSTPVILLSARAGEESRIEGMKAGADDYLVKPFGARELLARVDAHLKTARLRREGERTLRASEARLATELADTQLLQRVSSSLIRKNNNDALYDQILDAARSLMRSDMASIQMRALERNELFLLAQQGFHPESAKFWEWVRAGEATCCGESLARGEPSTRRAEPHCRRRSLGSGRRNGNAFSFSALRHPRRPVLAAHGTRWALRRHDFDALARGSSTVRARIALA